MKRFHVPARSGLGFEVSRGESFRVIDSEGEQVADLVAFARDEPSEQLSNGRTFDYNGTLYLTRGHTLFSDRSNAMLALVADDVGRHDFLHSACSPEMFRIQYGIQGEHPSCLRNLEMALAERGIRPEILPTPFNVFMNVDVHPEGGLEVRTPRSKAGDAVTFRAEMNLVLAVSACSTLGCNGGRCTAIEVELEGRT